RHTRFSRDWSSDVCSSDLKNSSTPLTEELLLHWHKILMESEKGITAGQLRTGTEPMQVVSGRYGDFTVHYEAPLSKDLPELISRSEERRVGKERQSLWLQN